MGQKKQIWSRTVHLLQKVNEIWNIMLYEGGKQKFYVHCTKLVQLFGRFRWCQIIKPFTWSQLGYIITSGPRLWSWGVKLYSVISRASRHKYNSWAETSKKARVAALNTVQLHAEVVFISCRFYTQHGQDSSRCYQPHHRNVLAFVNWYSADLSDI